jgi:hypothetical protein
MSVDQKRVTVESGYGIEDSVRRLRKAYDEMSASTDLSWGLSGVVSAKSVRLMRVQQTSNSIFRPEFTGSFEMRESKCFLSGTFSTNHAALVVMRLWAISLVTIIVGATYVSFKYPSPYSWILPIGGIFILGGGYLFVVAARAYYRTDVDVILRFITESIRGTIASNPL